MADKKKHSDLVAYDDNPYGRQQNRPEDVVRIFYTFNVSIIPVISQKNILIGCLVKDDVVAELSDIERNSSMPIDQFITRVARKMTFDDLLPHGKQKIFKTINIFGEIQDDWTRGQLFGATEQQVPVSGGQDTGQPESNAIEWMIYMILEHLPRALYALNQKGNTIFYNSYFEELYQKVFSQEVDHTHVEKLLRDSTLNEPSGSPRGGDLVFYNNSMNAWYEKVSMRHEGKKAGFLILFNPEGDREHDLHIAGADLRNAGLEEILSRVEKRVIQMALDSTGSKSDAAALLSLNPKTFSSRMKKHSLN